MYKCESEEFKAEVMSLKEQISNSVKITTLYAADSKRQMLCPPFKIFLSGDETILDNSYLVLQDICKEKKWSIERAGHRDFIIDPDPNRIKCKF